MDENNKRILLNVKQAKQEDHVVSQETQPIESVTVHENCDETAIQSMPVQSQRRRTCCFHDYSRS